MAQSGSVLVKIKHFHSIDPTTTIRKVSLCFTYWLSMDLEYCGHRYASLQYRLGIALEIQRPSPETVLLGFPMPPSRHEV